jgi:predicted nucleotidyltransferase
MSTNATAILRDFARFVSTRDQCLLDTLLEEATDVIIFGSRAAGMHSKTSDLDILCVGVPGRYKSERLDIVLRTSSEIEHPKWLGSELAGHIATYGVVIRGRADWKAAVRLDEAAMSRKERRVVALVNGLWAYWDRIHPEFRRKYLTTIRREVQRLELLRKGVAIPPSPILDSKWKNEQGVADSWTGFFRTIKAGSSETRDRLLRTSDLIIPQPLVDTMSIGESARVKR